MTFQNNPYRIDRSVVPSAYRIALTPNLDTFRFDGHVDIDVVVHEPVSTITAVSYTHLTLPTKRIV